MLTNYFECAIENNVKISGQNSQKKICNQDKKIS